MVTSRLILSRHIRILSLLLLTMNAAALVLAVPVGVTVPPTNTMPARAIDTGIAPTPAIGAAAAAARTTDVTVADPVQPYGASVLVFPRRVDYTGEKLGYEKPTSYDDLYTNAVSGTGADADADAGAPPTPSVRYTKYPASVHVPLGYNRYKNGYYGYYSYRRAADHDDDDQAGTPGIDSYYKGERPGFSKEGDLKVYNGRTAEDDDVDGDDGVDNRFRHLHGHHHRHSHPHTPRHRHPHPHTPRISGSAPASVSLEIAPTPMAATVTAAGAAAATPTPQVAPTANVAAGLQGVGDQAQAQAEPRATANGAETQYIPLVSALLNNIPIVGPLVSGLLGGGGGGGIFGILGGGGGGGGLVNSVLGGVTSTGLGGLVNGAARAATAATNGALDAATAATNGALDAATAATDGVLGGLGI